MSNTEGTVASYQHLPTVAVREIIRQGQVSAQSMRLISNRWNIHVFEYLTGKDNRSAFPSLKQFSWRIDLQRRSHLSIQLDDKYRSYFGVEKWPCRHIVNNIVEVNFSVATYRFLPVWVWNVAKEVAKGYRGSLESILLDLISSDSTNSYMHYNKLLRRIALLLYFCSHIDRLVLDFQLEYHLAAFKIIKWAMTLVSVDHLELVGQIAWKPENASTMLDLIKEHPVKSFTIGMWPPHPEDFNTFFAEAVQLTRVCIRVNTWFGERRAMWDGLEQSVNLGTNAPIQIWIEYPKSGVVLIHVLPLETL